MNDLLGATGEGLGGAAESRWRPDRILSKRAINLLGTAAGTAGVVLLGLNLLMPSATAKSGTAWTEALAAPAVSTAPAVQAPVPPSASLPVVAPAAATDSLTLRSYAVALTDLGGLPPDVAPGTTIELWASWNSDEGMSGFQKIIDRATVERIAPPFLESASPVVLLQVATKRELRDLMWADRYGSLSAALLPQAAPATYSSPYLP